MLVGRLRFERKWALTVFWSALGVEVGKAMSWIGVGVVGWGLVTLKSSRGRKSCFSRVGLGAVGIG